MQVADIVRDVCERALAETRPAPQVALQPSTHRGYATALLHAVYNAKEDLLDWFAGVNWAKFGPWCHILALLLALLTLVLAVLVSLYIRT